MPFLAISARFPLGTFLGHKATGQRADLPDFARLHAALIHAAGKGSTAVETGDDLRPSESSLAALRWFEGRAPSSLGIPETTTVSGPRGSVTSYRDDGVLERQQGSRALRPRKTLKRQSDAVALAGPVWWAWDEELSADTFAVIKRLCEDVSCLGEADSPVILEAHDAETSQFSVTHRVSSPQVPYPPPGGLLVRSPMPGRLDALEEDYLASRPRKAPSVSADRSSESQVAASFKPTSRGVRDLDYRPVEATKATAPWNAGMVLGVTAPIHRYDVVAFCAALHRTLTRLLGVDSLPLLTGTYGSDAPRPANRVAIHYLEPGISPLATPSGGAFLILIPEGAEPEEAAVVQRLAQAVKRVYLGARGEQKVTHAEVVDVVDFWPVVTDGMVRLWRPSLAVVPEMNRPRKGADWSLDDTALLSLGHVLRDRIDVVIRPDEDRRQARIRAVHEAGAWAAGSRRITDSQIARYVHKAPPSLVVQPFKTTVCTGGLIPDRAAWALGQSRHIGGGFMVPFDVSPETAEHLFGRPQC